MTTVLQIDADGRVGVRTGKVELGQGLHTALAQIVADGLGVALDRIRMLPVDTASSPDQGVTSGSLSVIEAGAALRQACADWCATQGAPTGSAPRHVGQSSQRHELPAILAGAPHFIHDLRLDGLLHGRVRHPPQTGARVLAWDAAAAGSPGALLHRDGSLFGVIADSPAAADAALLRLDSALHWQSVEAPAEDAQDLQALPAETRVVVDIGLAAATGSHRLHARYTKPWIAHASVAPSCALARWDGDHALTVWSHTQGPFNLRRDLALAFGLRPDAVRVVHVPGAGCYGHNGADDVAFDAAWLARRVPGRPLRLVWSRADELSHSPFGPAMVVELSAAVDAQGRIEDWQHEVWSPGHGRRPGRSDTPALLGSWQTERPFAAPASTDVALVRGGGAERNAVPGYDFARVRVRCHRVVTQRRSSSLRSLGAFGNVFAAECFMDEIAHASGVEPLALRRRHLHHDARALAVLDAVAARAALTRPSQRDESVGHGLAVARYKGSGAWCAVAAEVQAGERLRVRRLIIAVDVGLVVNPDGVVNQIEGGAIQATSWTLLESAAPAHAGWADYPILRFTDVPAVEVILMPSTQPSLGAGEASLGPTAAAIANALFDALGVRVRDLPLSPERIVAAMAD